MRAFRKREKGALAIDDGVISTKFSDDYFNLTLPADLISAAATSPTWFWYIAALNVLGTPMLFSTTTLAAKLLPGASGDKKAIDKHHIDFTKTGVIFKEE